MKKIAEAYMAASSKRKRNWLAFIGMIDNTEVAIEGLQELDAYFKNSTKGATNHALMAVLGALATQDFVDEGGDPDDEQGLLRRSSKIAGQAMLGIAPAQ